MTSPAYTTPAREVVGVPERSGPAAGMESPRRDPIDRAFAQLRDSPRVVQLLLDLAGVGFTLLAFAHTPMSAEFLFHGVFVVLAVHAFLFGLRGTLLRIGIASLPLLVYANAGALGLIEEPLELSEWPLMFVIAVIVAWMADRRETTSRRYAALFRQASERLLTVQEDERRRIAGELHDGVGQVLTAVTLTLDAAGAAPKFGTARERIRLARELAGTALAGTRDLAHRIRPARLEERGLVPALRDLARQSGFPVLVTAEPGLLNPRLLGSTATVEVYRIVQEALANAARHSGADGAVVSLGRGPRHLTIEIVDHGRGFSRDSIVEPGIGLSGMEERAHLIGGSLIIRSQPAVGTRIALTVPIEAAVG